MAVDPTDDSAPRKNQSSSDAFLWPAKDLSVNNAKKSLLKHSVPKHDPLMNVKASQKSQLSRSSTAASALKIPITVSYQGDATNDPLSLMAAQAQNVLVSSSTTVGSSDPLGANLAVQPASNKSSRGGSLVYSEHEESNSVGSYKDSETSSIHGSELFVPWSWKRLEILEKFTTSEKLSITLEGVSKFSFKAGSAVEEKIARRLDQLDEMAMETGMTGGKDLTQKEYIGKIEEMNTALMSAWRNEEKVKSLKIAIQCTKLLTDTSVTEFYPSKFVLITDIVDTFGKLIYSRIMSKTVSLPEKFTPEMVPQSAKELCQNWFYKIYSIREMLPRLYVEASVLKCYQFLSSGEYKSALDRITKMIRGIGDPLVAVYTRAYLCRVCIQLAPEYRDCLLENFNDFLMCLNQIQPPKVHDIVKACNMELPAYYQLYLPAVEWILQCIICNASEDLLKSLKEKSEAHSVLQLAMFVTFPPDYVCQHLDYFLELIRQDFSGSEVTGGGGILIVRKSELYRILGEKCLNGSIPSVDRKLELLNEMWKAVLKVENLQEFMRVANVWIEFASKTLQPQQVDLLLKGLIKHVSVDRKYEKILNELAGSVRCIFRQSTPSTCAQLFSLENFLALLDLFQSDQSKRYEINHLVLELFINNTSAEQPCTDPIAVNALLRIGKNLHDNLGVASNKSVAALAREMYAEMGSSVSNGNHAYFMVADLILKIFERVSFEGDFEAQLAFYVEARGTFFLLESVIVACVHNVNALIMETLKRVPNQRHTKRTASFIRACIAYNIITIPSVDNIQTRLTLYLNSAQVALFNCSTAQADSLYHQLIQTIEHLPVSIYDARGSSNRAKPTEPWLISFSANLFSSLLLMPDYPDQGILFHFRNAINEFANYKYAADSPGKASIFINALKALSCFLQNKWPYKLPNVDNNGDLYGFGADKKFQAELGKMAKSLVTELNALIGGGSANSALVPLPTVIDYILTVLNLCQPDSMFVVKLSEKLIPDIIPKCSFKEKQLIRTALISASLQLGNGLEFEDAQIAYRIVIRNCC